MFRFNVCQNSNLYQLRELTIKRNNFHHHGCHIEFIWDVNYAQQIGSVVVKNALYHVKLDCNMFPDKSVISVQSLKTIHQAIV